MFDALAMMIGLGLLWLALVAGGFVLLVRGLRGQKVSDAPHCAACGYNLRGTRAWADACSECGTSLAGRPQAIRIGKRAASVGRVSAGASLMVVALAMATAALWPTATPAAVAAAVPPRPVPVIRITKGTRADLPPLPWEHSATRSSYRASGSFASRPASSQNAREWVDPDVVLSGPSTIDPRLDPNRELTFVTSLRRQAPNGLVGSGLRGSGPPAAGRMRAGAGVYRAERATRLPSGRR